MNKKILTLAAVASIAAPLAAPAAFAGGLNEPVVEAPVIEPVPVVVPVDGNWNGGYVGASLGYGRIDGGSQDGSGVIGGILGGYRWDLGKTVLGVEGDFKGGNIDNDPTSSSLSQVARLKFQAGYDLGRTLVYVTAGPGWAKGDVLGQSHSDTGWTAGVGVDYQLNEQWIVGGEATFNKFDDFDGTGVDFDGKAIELRAAYRF